MGDGFVQEVYGQGTIQMNISSMKTINNVLYVLSLDSNLFSVGQLLNDGYSVVLKNLKCLVYEDRTKKKLLFDVPMTKNKVFPINVALKLAQDEN